MIRDRGRKADRRYQMNQGIQSWQINVMDNIVAGLGKDSNPKTKQ